MTTLIITATFRTGKSLRTVVTETRLVGSDLVRKMVEFPDGTACVQFFRF